MKQWRQAILHSVPVTWIHSVSSQRKATGGPRCALGARASPPTTLTCGRAVRYTEATRPMHDQRAPRKSPFLERDSPPNALGFRGIRLIVQGAAPRRRRARGDEALHQPLVARDDSLAVVVGEDEAPPVLAPGPAKRRVGGGVDDGAGETTRISRGHADAAACF